MPILIYNAVSGELIQSISHKYETNKYCILWKPTWSPDSKYISSTCLTSGNVPAAVSIWDVETGALVRQFDEDRAPWRVQWSPDGTRLAIGYIDGNVSIYEIETGERLLSLDLGNSRLYPDWSPDSKFIASSDFDGNINIWNAETGDSVFSTNVSGIITEIDWLNDGQFIAYGGLFVPSIKRVWTSKEELIEHAYDCCIDGELTNDLRAEYGLPPRNDN